MRCGAGLDDEVEVGGGDDKGEAWGFREKKSDVEMTIATYLLFAF